MSEIRLCEDTGQAGRLTALLTGQHRSSCLQAIRAAAHRLSAWRACEFRAAVDLVVGRA